MPRPKQVGRRDTTHGIVVREQINCDPIIPLSRNQRFSSTPYREEMPLWMVGCLIGPKWTQIANWVSLECLYLVERYGGDDGTRTRGLCRAALRAMVLQPLTDTRGLPNAV